MVGYGSKKFEVKWPNNARIAPEMAAQTPAPIGAAAAAAAIVSIFSGSPSCRR